MSAIRTKLHHQLQTVTARIPVVNSTAATRGGVQPWNSRLRELAKKSLFSEALSVYLQMLRSGASPNAFTFPFALKSSAVLSLPVTGEQLHGQAITTGCLLEPFVQTSLISMYCKCNFVDVARQVFDENPLSRKLTVCYNALIAGYALNLRTKDYKFCSQVSCHHCAF
ncbi:unnamed protein product [Linum trigynum]|uniref:Pentatricopeptide repeat-containing protein n=1 Tax=Linum trigynum TaxID=586398 RepID=A0AAV2EUJ8_9ROSI